MWPHERSPRTNHTCARGTVCHGMMSAEDSNGSANGAESQVTSALNSPALPIKPEKVGFTPLVTVVGFHHARGPEVETWFGVEDGFDPAVEFDWSLLPFMALSDGAHA